MAHLTATGRAYRLQRYTRPAVNPSGGSPSLTTPVAGKIVGVVLEGTTPVTYADVGLYYRPNLRLVASQRTDQWGAFAFKDLDQTLLANYFVVALDPDGGTQYNARIYDRLSAVTSLTRPVVSNGFDGSLFGTSSTAYGGYATYIKGLTPLAYWRLKETSGTTFADEMGFAPMTSHGTFVLNQQSALFDADGASVTYTLASTTDYLGTGKITGLVAGATGFSIVAHVKLGDGASGMSMLSWRNYTAGGADYPYATLTHDRNVADDFSYESWSWATTATRPYALGVSDDRWHMTVLTYTTADNTMRLYIDGYLVDTKVQGTPPTFPNNASVTLFNNVDGQAPQSTNCSMAEVAVFDKPLTATQVMLAATFWAQKTKLNANDKAAGVTLSDSDMTATSSAGSWESVRATHRKTTGRWYWETVVTANPNDLGVLVGIAPYNMATNQYPGQISNSGGIWAKGASTVSQYYAGGSVFRPSLTAIPVGAVIGHVYDAELGTHDVYLDGVPLASCYGFSVAPYPAIAVYGGGSATAHFSNFTYTPPEFCLPYKEADYPTPTPVGYWDAANKAAAWKLSKNPRLAYGVDFTNNNYSVRGLPSRSSGQRYFEVRIDRGAVVAGTSLVVGVFGTSQSMSGVSYPGGAADSWGYSSDGASDSNKRNNVAPAAYGAHYTSGDVIGVAVDWTAGTIEFFKNGASQGVAYSSGVGGTLYPGVSLYQLVVQAVLNTGDVAFAYTPPTGFVAWGS